MNTIQEGTYWRALKNVRDLSIRKDTVYLLDRPYPESSVMLIKDPKGGPGKGRSTMLLNGRLQWTGAVVGMATKEEAIKNAAESRRITRKQGHIVARGLSA